MVQLMPRDGHQTFVRILAHDLSLSNHEGEYDGAEIEK